MMTGKITVGGEYAKATVGAVVDVVLPKNMCRNFGWACGSRAPPGSRAVISIWSVEEKDAGARGRQTVGRATQKRRRVCGAGDL